MDINGAHIKPRIIVVTDGHLTEFDLVEGPDKPGGLIEMEMVCVFWIICLPIVIFVTICVLIVGLLLIATVNSVFSICNLL